MNPEFFEKNKKFIKFECSLPDESEGFFLEESKSFDPILKVGNLYLHSRQDPKKEALRLRESLPNDNEERVFLLFGGGLGYLVPLLLSNKNSYVIWLEISKSILYHALHLFDYSESFNAGQLEILLAPLNEDDFLKVFKGKSNLPITFVLHKASVNWREKDYLDLRTTAERLFHKKDVNLATLTRFEKIWVKNFLENLPELSKAKPISLLFGLAKDVPIVVAGAGPSLSESLNQLQHYRRNFFLIAVDTALPILTCSGWKADLIYSVDPQALNSNYLEGQEGHLVFDPTSTYVSLRLSQGPKLSFISSSPFPFIKIIENSYDIPLGEIPFGGSVSTNASALGFLMGSKEVYLIGQDLAFTNEQAHSKGAILEERLNYRESRKFRRELHNFRQLNALSSRWVTSYTGKKIKTNEKMLIFKKWFEDQSVTYPWKNLSNSGSKLENIPFVEAKEAFSSDTSNRVSDLNKRISLIFECNDHLSNTSVLKENLGDLIIRLRNFYDPIVEGLNLSLKIYDRILKNQLNNPQFLYELKKMERIDEEVAGKKGLNETLALGIQRVIYSVTEAYEDLLNSEERMNPQLAIARKSIILYDGLKEAVEHLLRHCKRALIRIDT